MSIAIIYYRNKIFVSSNILFDSRYYKHIIDDENSNYIIENAYISLLYHGEAELLKKYNVKMKNCEFDDMYIYNFCLTNDLLF